MREHQIKIVKTYWGVTHNDSYMNLKLTFWVGQFMSVWTMDRCLYTTMVKH